MGWKNYTYQFEGLDKLLQRIDGKKAKLDAARPLNAYAVKFLKNNLFLEWTYNSNSIEGNTLSLQETRMVLEDGLTVGGKSLREHFEALNHHDAIAYLELRVSDTYLLNLKDILHIHSLVLQKIEKDYAGRFRDAGVRITGANFTPPNALKVDGLMEELIAWANGEAEGLHTLVKATIFHHRFVWIHPFFDGNGRTLRLVYNMLLMREGFPPAIILRNDRKKYYEALNKANTGDYAKLLLLVLQAAERSLDLYLASLTDNFDAYMPVSQIAEEPDVPYVSEYISLLARTGKIDAYKEGRIWLTTKEAVMNYRKDKK